VQALGPSNVIAIGEALFHGQGQNGAAMELDARWTAVYDRAGSDMKIRLLTGTPKTAPAPTK
jgi:hypothetical protein